MLGSGNHHQDDKIQLGQCSLDRLALVSLPAPTSLDILARSFICLFAFLAIHYAHHHISYPCLPRIVVSGAVYNLIYWGGGYMCVAL